VPTDVDTKIRKALWSESNDREELRAMCDYALGAAGWDLSLVSRRITVVEGAGPVSGHNGEWLSVVAGAHGRFLSLGDAEYAQKTAAAIDDELSRESSGFQTALALPGAELDVLRLAASLTHNCGDLDQGIGAWSDSTGAHSAEDGPWSLSRSRFHRLAHENRTPYGGVFQIAARLYRDVMAAEGHRHYPLRRVRALRQNPGLLLPLGPFLDDWGGIVATHPLLASADRAEVLAALVSGCRKVPNQLGYYRALAGFAATAPRTFENASASLPATAAKELRDLRKQIGVPRASFESMMRKKVAAVRETGPLHW